MNKTNNIQDKSMPYRTMSFHKITAPNKTCVNDPKSTRIEGKRDLRGGR